MCIRDRVCADHISASYHILVTLQLYRLVKNLLNLSRLFDLFKFLAVSYTHLDVYKRQLLGFGLMLGEDTFFGLIGVPNLDVLTQLSE